MKKVTLAFFAVIIVIVSVIFEKYLVFGKVISRYEQHKVALRTENSGNISGDNLVTHLPIICIDTNGQKIPGKGIVDGNDKIVDYEKGDNGEEQILTNITIYDSENAMNNIKNKPTLFVKALVNIRGNSSRAFEKSSYKIELVNESNLEEKYSIMGMAKGSKWALYAPYLDKTLIRNYMWLNISANIMGYAPDVRFCECYIDGEYKGVFVMMETIEKEDTRVNISSYDKDSRTIPYILKMDKIRDDNKDLSTFLKYASYLDFNAGFSVLYPKSIDLSEDVKTNIAEEISDFEKALYSYDFNDPKKGYVNYIDVDSWVDFYIIQEFLVNNDMCSRSTYLYKDKGGKLTMGPVWDFNNVCDNYLAVKYDTEGFFFAENRIWFEMLMKDEAFVKKVQKRYKELRNTYLNEEYLTNYIDETIEYLGDAIERNYEVWGYTFERENQTNIYEFLRPVDRNPQNYDEAVDQYKTFLINRGKWLDDNIDSLSQYCHPSKNKLYVE